jgi:hypothetical protein
MVLLGMTMRRADCASAGAALPVADASLAEPE